MKLVPAAVTVVLADLGSACANKPGAEWPDPHGSGIKSEPDL